MSHGVRIRPDPGWALGTKWLSSEQASLDAALVASINGDGGGTWQPTAPIIINGAGLRLIGTTGAVPHTMTGGASSVTTNPGAGAFITHGDSDYCGLGPGHTGSSVSIRSHITSATWASMASLGSEWLAYTTLPGESLTASGGIGPTTFLQAVAVGATCRVPLRVHNGSVLSSVTFTFVVQLAATAIPTVLPRFGIFAADLFGNTFPLANSTPYQHFPAPASPSAWSDSGNRQTFTFTSDIESANPYVLIDTSQFSYYAEILHVSGAGAESSGGVTYFDPVANFTDVLDIRPR